MLIWDFFIMAGGVFSCILMLSSLLRKGKNRIHYVMAGVYFCHMVIVIGKGLACSGIVLRYPVFMHWDLFAFYLISPAIYFYLKAYIDPDFQFKKIHFLNLIPFIMVVLLYIPFFLKPLDQRLSQYPYYLGVEPGPLRIIYAFSYFCPSLMIFLYVIMGLRQFALRKSFEILFQNGPSRIIIFLLFEIIILAGMMISAYFFWSYNYYRVIFLCLNQVVVCFFLINQRYPGLYSHLKSEMQKNRVIYTHLNNVDVEEKISLLESLMVNQKIFKNADLTLERLSRAMKINSHQLSEILNKRMNCSFKTLINRFRLEEAESLLINYPEKNILDIAFDAGFKSKSAFNVLFSHEKGMTPSEFRKKINAAGA